MYSLRERGVKALEEPDTKRRRSSATVSSPKWATDCDG